MKKQLLLVTFLLFTLQTFSQVKVGLIVSPGVAFSRTSTLTPNKTFRSDGAGFRFLAGPELSFYFAENYAFVTGLLYLLKRASYNADSGGYNNYNLQYIQLPATFKLFTNEIATDMKLYFQLGGAFDIKLKEKQIGLNYDPSSEFKPIDASLILGSGIELQMGENTFLLLGARYTRGLLNTAKGSLGDQLGIRNDLVTADIGIRF